MEHYFSYDDLMAAADPVVQRFFDELERVGYIRRIDRTPPDERQQVFPTYELVTRMHLIEECFDDLERDGKIVRTGEYRDGKPVYIDARFAPKKLN
jgi:hypothetical protein